jgi:RNase P subunit RPR2
MEAKQSSLHIKKSNPEDLCKICDSNLYYDKQMTKRIGLLDIHREVKGWICPKCNSEFDLEDNIVYIYGENSIQGKA